MRASTPNARPPIRPRLRIAAIGTRGVPSSYSGIERVAESLYAILAARGHAVTVYCRAETLATAAATYRGIHLLRAPALSGRALGTASHVTTSMLHAVGRDRYDVIHLHALAPGLVAWMSRARRIPTVATVHGLDWQRAKWRGMGARVLRTGERWLVRHADAIIAVSRDLAQYYDAEYGRATVLIPNGTDPTPDTPLDGCWLAQVGLEPARFCVAVARLVPEKRLEDLIRAYAQTDTPFKLAIVGGSSHTDAYVESLHALAAADPRVLFLGTLPRERLDTLYRAAAVYVHPSELEGMSIAMLQALESGLPVVASDIPVHRELLGAVEGYDLFFTPRDVEALTERLTRVTAALPHYRRIAARAQAHVQQAYSWEAIADRTEALFYDLVERRRRGRRRRFAATGSAQKPMVAQLSNPLTLSLSLRERGPSNENAGE
jgi:glycosyltransferase involved in cell wall biosynthesis